MEINWVHIQDFYHHSAHTHNTQNCINCLVFQCIITNYKQTTSGILLFYYCLALGFWILYSYFNIYNKFLASTTILTRWSYFIELRALTVFYTDKKYGFNFKTINYFLSNLINFCMIFPWNGANWTNWYGKSLRKFQECISAWKLVFKIYPFQTDNTPLRWPKSGETNS